jgi:alanine dehydrogenase
MRVGIPTETENHEYRVTITPAGVEVGEAPGYPVLPVAEAVA